MGEEVETRETTRDNVRELYPTQVRTRSSEFHDQIRVEVDSSGGPRICVRGDTWDQRMNPPGKANRYAQLYTSTGTGLFLATST